jgi:tRNA(Glu) U13 pseudouridine synthase TruD
MSLEIFLATRVGINKSRASMGLGQCPIECSNFGTPNLVGIQRFSSFSHSKPFLD